MHISITSNKNTRVVFDIIDTQEPTKISISVIISMAYLQNCSISIANALEILQWGVRFNVFVEVWCTVNSLI